MRNLIFLILTISSQTVVAQTIQNTEICQTVIFDGVNGVGETPHFKITAYNSCFVLENKPKATINGINTILFLGKEKLSKKKEPAVVCGFSRPYFEWHTKIENGWLVDLPNEYGDCFNDAFAKRGELKIEICYLMPVPVLSLKY